MPNFAGNNANVGQQVNKIFLNFLSFENRRKARYSMGTGTYSRVSYLIDTKEIH